MCCSCGLAGPGHARSRDAGWPVLGTPRIHFRHTPESIIRSFSKFCASPNPAGIWRAFPSICSRPPPHGAATLFQHFGKQDSDIGVSGDTTPNIYLNSVWSKKRSDSPRVGHRAGHCHDSLPPRGAGRPSSETTGRVRGAARPDGGRLHCGRHDCDGGRARTEMASERPHCRPRDFDPKHTTQPAKRYPGIPDLIFLVVAYGDFYTSCNFRRLLRIPRSVTIMNIIVIPRILSILRNQGILRTLITLRPPHNPKTPS